MTTSRSAATVGLCHSAFAIAGTAFAAVLAFSSPARADDTPANLLPNYTVTSSFSGRSRHTGANNVGVLFDNATTTYIGFNQSSATLYINFTLNEAVVANAYGVACGPSAYYSATGRAPRAFSLAAYDETAEEWVELDSRSGVSSWTLEEIKVFHFANTTAYAKWRLAITQGTGYVGLSEIQLYNVDNSGVLDVESNAGEFAVPSPAYGTGHRFATGSTVTCSITGQDGVFTDGQGGKYVFGGYALYTNVDINPLLAQSGAGTSVTYVQESHSRLVWKWTLAPLHVATDGNDENDGFSWATAKATLAGAISAASVAGQQIFIGDGAYPVAATISITKDVRVVAAEGASPVLVGGGANRVLTLNHASAVVEGLVISNGYATGGESFSAPSGVLISAGTLRDCTVTGCLGEDYGCPALLVNGANAVATGCVITNNAANHTNTNKRPYILHGGGAAVFAGRLEKSLVAGNSGGCAAGVYQTGGTVADCVIAYNIGSSVRTHEPAAMGGTETVAWGTVFLKGGTMTGCAIVSNVAASAAGAYVIGTGVLTNCLVGWNHATHDIPMTIAASSMRVSEQQPSLPRDRLGFGGVVLNGASAKVLGCTMRGNDAARCGFDQGLHVLDGTVADNVLDANGEDVNTSASTSRVAYAVPDDGQSGVWPYATPETAARSVQDAIDAVAATPEALGTVILAGGTYAVATGKPAFVLKRPVLLAGPADGTPAVFTGGGVAGPKGAWVAHPLAVVSNVTFSAFGSSSEDPVAHYGINAAYNALVLYAGTVSDSTITGSVKLGNSSAVWLMGGTLRRCQIRDNYAASHWGDDRGGGIRAFGGIVEDSLVARNTASNGGGIYVQNTGVTIRRTRIDGNASSGYSSTALVYPGAGLCLAGGATVENCLIVSNRATVANAERTGAGVYMANGKLLNCTVADNAHAHATAAAGIYQRGGEIVNTLLWNNTSLDFGGPVTNATASLLGNVDPLFETRAGRAYWPAKGSPCVNAGTNDIWTVADTDIAGRRRIVSRTVDIGCFERPLDPGTVLSVR